MNNANRVLLPALALLAAGSVLAQAPAPHQAPAHSHAADSGSPVVATGAASAAPCPTAAERARIAAAYAGSAAAMPFAVAPKLQLAEVVVAAGLPPALGVGVDASRFRAVWDSLRAWPQSTVMIRKGGNVFEVSTRIPAGEPSKRSSYFNLEHDTAISGHLRPDLLTAIQGVNLVSAEGAVRGVFFYDASGESVFGVFLPGEGAKPEPAAVAAFEKTWALLQSLPPRCPRDAAG